MERLNLAWLKAAVIRAVKTAAQTAIGMVTIGAAFSEVNWGYIFSVSGVAAILSILTSIAGLPETKAVGNLNVHPYNKATNEEVYYVDVPVDFDPKDGDIVNFRIKRDD